MEIISLTTLFLIFVGFMAALYKVSPDEIIVKIGKRISFTIRKPTKINNKSFFFI
ncbi:MAG: hypothetical protein ACRCTZ_05250 [Sarcina sp.]